MTVTSSPDLKLSEEKSGPSRQVEPAPCQKKDTQTIRTNLSDVEAGWTNPCAQSLSGRGEVRERLWVLDGRILELEIADVLRRRQGDLSAL